MRTITYSISYHVHCAINRIVKKEPVAKYPSLNKRIIGKLLKSVGLFEYPGNYSTVFDKEIENLIKRGHPLNIGRPTRKQRSKK